MILTLNKEKTAFTCMGCGEYLTDAHCVIKKDVNKTRWLFCLNCGLDQIELIKKNIRKIQTDIKKIKTL